MSNGEEKKSPTKWIVLGCGGCLVVFLVFFALMFGTVWIATSGPVKVIDAQLAALNEGDLQKAYDFCSQGFKNATSFEKFKAFVEANPQVFKSKDSSFTKRNISGNQGTFRGTITGQDGTVTPVKYTMVKEGESWKILGIDLKTSD
jgi:hypothetical protein